MNTSEQDVGMCWKLVQLLEEYTVGVGFFPNVTSLIHTIR